MSKSTKTRAPNRKTIALNRKASHEYTIEARLEAGIVLEGWEVKSLRAGRVQLSEGYVILKKSEAWLIGCTITPLPSASTHTTTDPTRTRKLLLHRKELNTLIGATERKGYTIIPMCLYWKKNNVKCEVALAKGKKRYDKRASEKDRDWQRQKQKLLKKEKR